MIPNHCRVRHDPANGTFGDCIRACIASVMDMERPEDVPHFIADGCTDGEIVIARVREWLSERGFTVFTFGFPGEPIADVLAAFGEQNPFGHYLLFGSTGEADHVVVARGGKIVHNPAWYGGSLVGPTSHGHWQIWVIGRL